MDSEVLELLPCVGSHSSGGVLANHWDSDDWSLKISSYSASTVHHTQAQVVGSRHALSVRLRRSRSSPQEAYSVVVIAAAPQ